MRNRVFGQALSPLYYFLFPHSLRSFLCPAGYGLSVRAIFPFFIIYFIIFIYLYSLLFPIIWIYR